MGIPFAPNISQVISKQGSALVFYHPSSNTGGLPLISYNIYAYNSNGVNISQTSALAGSSSTRVTGLVGGSNVSFAITSMNALGMSSMSSLTAPATIDYTCFHSKTKVLTLINNKEVYLPITELKKGNLVKTYKHGYIKIFEIQKSFFQNENITFSSPNPRHLYILSKNSFPELTEDLILTGNHSLLVDKLTDEQVKEILKENNNKYVYVTDDKYRLFTYLDPKVELYNDEFGRIEIWNVALENASTTQNYGIYVNGGLLVESLPICKL